MQGTGTMPSFSIVAHSHLRWDFVWQRPQHLMSRFARDREVFFIEEPSFQDNAGDAPDGGRLEVHESNGVTVGQPICRDPGPGGGPRLDAMYRRLAADHVAERGLKDYIVWFYTPMLLPATERLSPALVVYDAMDELSLFKGAPPELLPRERELLKLADVVFTGAYAAYARRLGLRFAASAIGMAVGLAAGLGLSISLNTALPELPFLGAGFLLPNVDLLAGLFRAPDAG